MKARGDYVRGYVNVPTNCTKPDYIDHNRPPPPLPKQEVKPKEYDNVIIRPKIQRPKA